MSDDTDSMETRIRLAVEIGSEKYWKDAWAQQEIYKRWRERGFQGQCEQITRGSIVDYITREVVKTLETKS